MIHQSKHLDPALWEVEALKLHIDGENATLELEAFFWRRLESLALKEGLSLIDLIKRLYDFAIAEDLTNGTFPGFLRICGCRLAPDESHPGSATGEPARNQARTDLN